MKISKLKLQNRKLTASNIALPIISAAAVTLAVKVTHKPELTGKPTVGKWYRITPENALNADGSAWHGLIRIGEENKVLVYFYGGGVSMDSHMAAHPADFYTEKLTADGIEHMGIGSRLADNPYNNWTVLVLPYTTGDFHTGTGEYIYTGKNGKKAILYHHGYLNYTAFMQKAVQYIKKPDTVMAAGYSAGGFAAALLADDLLTKYFPDTPDSAVLADGSLLIYDKWHFTAENIWHMPKAISGNIISDNIVLDALRALSGKHPKTKILFCCSVRDGTLASYQNYLDNKVMKPDEKAGDVFQKNLRNMTNELRKLPNTGIFIWDNVPYFYTPSSNLTWHTILAFGFVHWKFGGHTVSGWTKDALNGNVRNYGIELTEKQY